jgi:hypothetical protein
MSKVMGTMMTIWGLAMMLNTYFVYLNSPAHIAFNGDLKYSLIESGVMLPAAISLLLSIAGISFLLIAREPRQV